MACVAPIVLPRGEQSMREALPDDVAVAMPRFELLPLALARGLSSGHLS